MPTKTPPASLNDVDAAAYTGFSPWYLREARLQGRGPSYIRIGRTIRYRIADLDEWLAKHVVRTEESA